MKNWRRIINFATAGVMAFCMVSGCGNSADSTGTSSETSADVGTSQVSSSSASNSSAASGSSVDAQVTPPADLVTDGKLTYVTAATFAPYEYVAEDGSYVGFDIEMAEAMADLMGLDVEVIDMTFDGLISALQGGRADIINSAMYINEERDEEVDFIPYMYIGDTILVRAGNDLNIQSTDDLSGKTVAVTAGAIEEVTCNEFNDEFAAAGMDPINILQLPTSNDAVVAVQNGQADCMIYSTASAAYAMSQEPGVFEAVVTFNTDTEIGIAVRTGDTEMQNAISECLNILVENGTYAKLMEKYNFSEDVSYFK